MDPPGLDYLGKKQMLLIGAAVVVLGAVAFSAWKHYSTSTQADVDPAHCDVKTSDIKRSAVTNDAASATMGEPPIIDEAKPSGSAPEGMVWIPAGMFSMGTEEPGFPDTRPIHRVSVDGFWMDKTEVTNEEFAKFVKATRYVTVAERKPKAEDYPGAPAENLVAGSVVFSPPGKAVPLDDHFQWWSFVPGASWRSPEGPQSSISGREKHPVVHIAYEDAIAFAKWAGKRLPTEAEFEWAARGGLDRKKYPWGDEFKPEGKFRANSFQGHFPERNTVDDGFAATAPAGTFEANAFGLFDMAGNVWEWCSDWYRADYYKTLAAAGIAENPQGPNDSLDPSEPGVAKRVHKGGSFLCTDQYRARYMPGGRGKGAPDTGTNHVGFRLVRNEN